MQRIGVLLLLLALIAQPVIARQAASAADLDVFVSSPAANGVANSNSKASVYFVDARTGLSTVVVTNGINAALLGGDVIFVNKDTGKVGIAHRDGTSEAHPFIESSEVLNWVVSPDRRWITWAAGRNQAGSLIVDLYAARADGANKGIVLHTSSSKGIGVRPLAITNDGATIFYTRQFDDPKAYQPFPQASDVFRLNVSTGESTRLTGEPRCRCAAAFNGSTFFRLENTAQGFAAHFIDLALNTDVRADPPNLNYSQAGYALISDKGNYAVYSLAKGTQVKGAPDQYALVLADASQRKQSIILPASPNRLRPVVFGQNVLTLIGVDKDGTYKLSLADGTLTQVSNYNYLGTLSSSP